jgi:glycosyltransferase involved in cell wall biosynthesis
VQQQTRGDWEAVVVNNYSDDDTVAVVGAFQDPRIRLENFRNNGVIGASRNRGIQLARGDFIAFLDSDDIWLPHKLDLCMARFTPEIGLVGHDLERFGLASGRLRSGPAARATFRQLLLRGSCITPSAAIVRTDVLRQVGGFTEAPEMVTAEDYHLWLKLAAAGTSMAFIPEVLTRYRVHTGSQSASAQRHMNAVLQVVEQQAENSAVTVKPDKLAMRRRRSMIAYGAGRSMQSSGGFREAWRFFGRAVGLWPFEPRIYAALAINGIGALRAALGRKRGERP